jgi:hypothetical protein
LNNFILKIYFFYFKVSRQINGANNSDDIRCNKKTEILMDSSVSKIIVIGQRSLKFPENAQQLRIYCNNVMRFVDYITTYSQKCMPNFAKEATKILMYSISKEMKTICKSGKLSAKASELLKAAPCGNAGLDHFQKCNFDFIDSYMGIMDAAIKLRIPMACWLDYRSIRYDIII